MKRAEVQQGGNPAAEKQKAKATAARDWTVGELVKATLAKELVSLAHSTQVSCGRDLKRVEKKLADVPWAAVGFVGMTAWLRDAGMALFVPVASSVLAAVAAIRWVARRRLAWQVDRAIDLEAWRTAKGPVPLH